MDSNSISHGLARDADSEIDLRDELGSSLNSAQFDSLLNGCTVNVNELDEFFNTIARQEPAVNGTTDRLSMGILRTAPSNFTGNVVFTSNSVRTIKSEPLDDVDAQRDGTAPTMTVISPSVAYTVHPSVDQAPINSGRPLNSTLGYHGTPSSHNLISTYSCTSHHTQVPMHTHMSSKDCPVLTTQLNGAVRPTSLSIATSDAIATLNVKPKVAINAHQVLLQHHAASESQIDATNVLRIIKHEPQLGSSFTLPPPPLAVSLAEKPPLLDANLATVAGETIISRQSPTPTLGDESVTPSCSGRRTIFDKASDEYRLRRERNNVAVRKSREKAKARHENTNRRVKDLASENDQLLRKLESVLQELKLLKSLFQKVGAPIPDNVPHTLGLDCSKTSGKPSSDIAASLSALCAESASLLSDVLTRRGCSTSSAGDVLKMEPSSATDNGQSAHAAPRNRRSRRDSTHKTGTQQSAAASVQG